MPTQTATPPTNHTTTSLLIADLLLFILSAMPEVVKEVNEQGKSLDAAKFNARM